MSEDVEYNAEKAMLNIALRQIAPAMRNIFEMKAHEWGENMFMLFISISYIPGGKLDSYEGTELAINSIATKKHAVIPYESSQDVQQLYDFFPYMVEHFQEIAKEWGVTEYDIFMMARYISGRDLNNPGESVDLQIRTKASVPPEKQKAKSVFN